jgi:hypothetical protein
LGIKTDSYDLVISVSKLLRRFLSLDLKTKWTTVCRLRHKIDGRRDDVVHVSRFSGLLHVEVSRANVFQSALKTSGGATAGGERGTIAEVASSLS